MHYSHCNQGEYVGSCKYGDADCPMMSGITDDAWTATLLDKIQQLEAENKLLMQDLNRLHSGKLEQLEAEKKVLREGIIRALQIPIGAVLDQHTRFALTDALKEVDDAAT